MVPGDRFGCPDFDMADVEVGRTVLVSVFPKEVVGLQKKKIPSAPTSSTTLGQSADLLRLAKQPSEPLDVMSLNDNGYYDAEK